MSHEIHWALNLKTPTTGDVLTLSAAKAHLRVDDSDEDTLIQALVDTAVEHAQDFTGRQLLTATWECVLDCFPYSDIIKLPNPPLQSVTSVKYIDTAGVLQTVATTVYGVDTNSVPARLYLLPSQTWPQTRSARSSVTIELVAGYGLAADIPKSIISAMKLMIGHWFENREDVIVGTTASTIPNAADMLLSTYRTPGLE